MAYSASRKADRDEFQRGRAVRRPARLVRRAEDARLAGITRAGGGDGAGPLARRVDRHLGRADAGVAVAVGNRVGKFIFAAEAGGGRVGRVAAAQRDRAVLSLRDAGHGESVAVRIAGIGQHVERDRRPRRGDRRGAARDRRLIDGADGDRDGCRGGLPEAVGDRIGKTIAAAVVLVRRVVDEVAARIAGIAMQVDDRRAVGRRAGDVQIKLAGGGVGVVGEDGDIDRHVLGGRGAESAAADGAAGKRRRRAGGEQLDGIDADGVAVARRRIDRDLDGLHLVRSRREADDEVLHVAGRRGIGAGPDRVPGVAGILQVDLGDEAIAGRFADEDARGIIGAGDAEREVLRRGGAAGVRRPGVARIAVGRRVGGAERQIEVP